MEKDALKYIEQPLATRLKKNTFSNMLFFILTFPLMFILTPMVLRSLGAETYGIWVIAITLTVFIEMFGGINTGASIAVMVPKFDPKKEADKISSLASTAWMFYATMAVLMAAGFFFFGGHINDLLGIKAEGSHAVAFAVYLFLVNFSLLGMAYVMGGFNILYPANYLHILTAYARTILIILVLNAGYGINAVIGVQLGLLIVESLILVIILKKVYPLLMLNPLLFDIKLLKQMLVFGYKFTVSKAASVMNANFDKLLLAMIINPAAVASYQIGATISKYISMIPESLGMISLLPAVSELKAKGMEETIYRLLERAMKYIMFLAILAVSGIIVFGREFIILWVGPEYSGSYEVMLILALAYIPAVMMFPLFNLLNGIERMKETAYISMMSVVITLGAGIPLVYKYGIKGMAAGIMLSNLLSLLITLYYFKKHFKAGFPLVRTLIYPAFIALVCSLAFVALKSFIKADSGWLIFFAEAGCFTAAFSAIAYLAKGYFDESEKASLLSVFKRPGKLTN